MQSLIFHQVHCCVCTKWCAGNCGVVAALYWALYCMCWSDCALYAEKGIPAWKVAAKSWALRVWQGFPSLTKTGTATRLGEGRWVTSIPFSARALFILYRWFWNQIFTWVGVRRIKLARCSLSGAERYLCCLKRRSSSYVCALENKTLLLRFFPESLPLLEVSLSLSGDSSADGSGDLAESWLLADRPCTAQRRNTVKMLI